MKRAIMSLVIAGVVGAGLVLASPSKASAHERPRVSVIVGAGRFGGFGVGVGYGHPYRYYTSYRPVIAPVAPIVVPSCCRYERVYVPEFWDVWGNWHPGYYRTYRVCSHHGRLLVH